MSYDYLKMNMKFIWIDFQVSSVLKKTPYECVH